MQIKSLGHRTDLIFPRYDGIIREREDYLAIETPSNPHFHWGNFLLFKNPPRAGDFEKWHELFKKEFSHNPEIDHITFGWDGVDGDKGVSEPFLAKGFSAAEQVVLVADKVVRPPRFNDHVTVRVLADEFEWSEALENQIACRDEAFSYDAYKVFKSAQLKRYREMQVRGLGFWFGAFIEGKLVGSLGLFTDGDLGRFQQVGVNPAFRRQGICATMVYLVAAFGFEKMNLKNLVMVSDNEDARRVYESVGFSPKEKQSGLSWWKE